MPPRGVKAGSKRARQDEQIKSSERESGVSNSRSEEIAARTVNQERSEAGESSRKGRGGSRKRSAAKRAGGARKSSRGGAREK